MKSRRYLCCLLLDAVLFSGLIAVCYLIRSQFVIPGHLILPASGYLSFFALLVVTWMFFLHLYGLYGSVDPYNLTETLKALAKANYHYVVVIATVAFVLHMTNVSRSIFAGFTLLANVVVLATRRARPYKQRTTYAIVGRDATAFEAFELARQVFSPQLSVFSGFYALDPEGRAFFAQQAVPVDGSEEKLLELIREGEVNTVILALPNDFSNMRRFLEHANKGAHRILLAHMTTSQLEFIPVEV